MEASAAAAPQSASADQLSSRDAARTRRMSVKSQVMHQSASLQLSQGGKNLSHLRMKAVEEQLLNEDDIDAKQQQFAQVAEKYNTWLLQQLEVIEERFAPLENVTLGVTTLSDVVLYDVKCLKPYKAKLDETDKHLLEQSNAYLDELDAITENLRKNGVEPEDDNRFTFFDIMRCQDAGEEFEKALTSRQDAFAAEEERITHAHDTFMKFCKACNDFQDLAEGLLERVKNCAGLLPDVLRDVKDLFNDGRELNAAFALVSQLSAECRSLGVVGTNLTVMKLQDDADAGLLAVSNWIFKYVDQLENELKLKSEYNKRAAEFTEWVNKTTPKYTPEALPNNLAKLDELTVSLHTFRSEEKPQKERDLRFALELKRVVEKTLQFQGREGFSPLQNVTLDAQYSALMEKVENYDEWLRSEVTRQRDLGNLVQQFTADAVDLLEWLKDKQEFLNSSFATQPKSKSAARSTKALMESYALEYQERVEDMKKLETLGIQVVEQNYERWDKIAALYDKLIDGFFEASVDNTIPKMPPLPKPKEAIVS